VKKRVHIMVYISCAAEWGGGGREIREKRHFYGLWSVLLLFTLLTYCIHKKRHPSICARHTITIIEYRKGYRAVLYSDFVTILRLASMQYITKLVTSQSQKPRSSLPQNIK
jgi:hypothetical protein